MKKILIALIALSIFLIYDASAFEQTNNSCYAYCAGYKLYWQDDPMWAYIKDKCVMDTQDTFMAVVKFGKATVSQGLYLEPIFQAYYCSEYIQGYIVPILNTCKNVCNADKFSYAPDLIVTRRSGNYNQPGPWYYEDPGKLNIEVYNDGRGYADDILVQVFTAATIDKNCEVKTWTKLKEYTIPELAPHSAIRNDEGLPFKDSFDIAWDPVKDKCNKVKVIVDPFNEVPEWAEPNLIGRNNEYILEINDLPTPPRYQIDEVGYEYEGLDDIMLWFTVTNLGEETGWPIADIKKCDGEALGSEILSIQNEGSDYVEFHLTDLSKDSDKTIGSVCLEILVSDAFSDTHYRKTVTIFSGMVKGTVLDMYGKPVKDATVTLSNGMTTKTDTKGNYQFTGIGYKGFYTLTAESLKYTETGHANVTIDINEKNTGNAENLTHYNVDMVLMDMPGSIEVICPYGAYGYRMTSGAFTYIGSSWDNNAVIRGIVPGEYFVMLSKEGYGASYFHLNITTGETSTVMCNLKPKLYYTDDSGINFEPEMNIIGVFNISTIGKKYVPYAASISDDGSTAYVAVSDPSLKNSAKILVFSTHGEKLREIPIESNFGELKIELRPNYDGSLLLIGNKYVFTKTGEKLAENPKGNIADKSYISADGSYICSLGLYASDFTPISARLVDGSESDRAISCPSSGSTPNAMVFLMDDSMLGSCRNYDNKGKLCKINVGREEVFADVNAFSLASTPDGDKIVYSDTKDTYYYDWQQRWSKNISTKVYSISPGGNYVIALETPSRNSYMPHIYDATGNELLSEGLLQKKDFNQFMDVKATGTGIYYIRYDGQLRFGLFGEIGQARQHTSDTGMDEKDPRITADKKTSRTLGDLLNTVLDFFKSFFR